MGLFDMFKGDTGAQMTPHLAFATSLLYMMSADGEMDNEEVGHLLSVLGGSDDGHGNIGVGANNKALLDNAMKYRRKNSIETFLQEATPLLSDAQKMCILVNLIDSSLADGQPEPEEQAHSHAAEPPEPGLRTQERRRAGPHRQRRLCAV